MPQKRWSGDFRTGPSPLHHKISYNHKDTTRRYQHGTDDDLQRRLFVQEKEGKQNSNHHAQLVDRCHTGDISQLNCLEIEEP